MSSVTIKIRNNAKQLRSNQTDAEKHLWYLLRGRRLSGYKFKRQYPIGEYIVDFICIQRRVIIELDGGQHFDAQEYDAKRTDFLSRCGYQVLRFWNDEVFLQTEAVVNIILDKLQNTS